jgi:hypothetical protein
LDQSVIDGLRNFSAWDEVEKGVIRAEKAAVKIVPFTDSTYPARCGRFRIRRLCSI